MSNQRETYGSNVSSGRTTGFLARVHELCESRGGRPGQTPNTGLRHPFFNWRQVPESGVRSVPPGLTGRPNEPYCFGERKATLNHA